MTDYKSTINLPQTEFPMKADLARREPAQLERWQRADLYNAMLQARAGKPTFLLHDGPPYANGDIHFGHILNKVLKDIVVKSHAMAGFHTPFIPGWDCHGLPIELAAEKELGGRDANRDAITLRTACRNYAQKFVQSQSAQFQRLGCFADWMHPYRTMDHSYQAAIAREFARIVESGAVYSGKRPIYWCASCRTALAEAEVEYEQHTSPSIYVKFALQNIDDLRTQLKTPAGPVFAVIWTTTPWTIPANLGICLHPDFEYATVRVGTDYWILARDLVQSAMTAMKIADYEIVATFSANILERRAARHPLLPRDSLIVLGTHVTLDAGTGCVHTAPGHGQDDFRVGQAYGLAALAPIDDGGKFTDEAGLPAITGLFIAKANPVISKMLADCGALVHEEKISHQFPHCWRCKNPLLFRTTEQWFISMESTDLRKRALDGINQVAWIPAWGKNRINGMMDARPDWCISRQRTWGVPLIAARCTSCDERGTTPEFIRHVAAQFDTHGADYWYQHDLAELLPPAYACPHCHRAGPFTKEPDILDVWFDSGCSFAAVAEARLGQKNPIDLYLEGSDQHRGWFHTSLLISEAARNAVPYKTVFTHGFVVDGDGRKYSKSAKNYTPPDQIMAKYGAELLRLWVAAEDYRNDIRVSDEILARIAESYRKIRNTWRFLLGNLCDFHPATDMVPYARLGSLERWILHSFATVVARCRTAYDDYEFHTMYHAVNSFCAVDLSARYFDICKDRLYCGSTTGADRRAIQTVMWQIGEALTRLIAPVLSFTAEEVWGFLPADANRPTSVFLADLPTAPAEWLQPDLSAAWDRFWNLRETATKALETARAVKAIGNALDAQLTIDCPPATQTFLESFGLPVADLLLVSQMAWGTTSGEFTATADRESNFHVSVTPITTAKCERCWKRAADIGGHTDHPTLCGRCAAVVK